MNSNCLIIRIVSQSKELVRSVVNSTLASFPKIKTTNPFSARIYPNLFLFLIFPLVYVRD